MFGIGSLRKKGDIVFKIYEGVGIFAMGLLAACVIFAVIARYFFSLSWKQLAEFTTTLFAFTTFWGMGICVLKDENIVIDILINQIPGKARLWVNILDKIIVLIVNIVFFYFSISYVQMAGEQISFGMGIPMKFMYGIMPVSSFLCILCILIKIAESAMDFAGKYDGRK